VFPKREDSMSSFVTREVVAPPGSKATSRAKGSHWNMRDPTGSATLVRVGDHPRGNARADVRAEVGSRTHP
jgi:hypothetical protein